MATTILKLLTAIISGLSWHCDFRVSLCFWISHSLMWTCRNGQLCFLCNSNKNSWKKRVVSLLVKDLVIYFVGVGSVDCVWLSYFSWETSLLAACDVLSGIQSLTIKSRFNIVVRCGKWLHDRRICLEYQAAVYVAIARVANCSIPSAFGVVRKHFPGELFLMTLKGAYAVTICAWQA